MLSSASALELSAGFYLMLSAWLFGFVAIYRTGGPRATRILLLLAALTIFAGALTHATVVVYRYDGQDAYNYFLQGIELRQLAFGEPDALRLLWEDPAAFRQQRCDLLTITRPHDAGDLSNWLMLVTTVIFTTLALDNYLGTALLFAGAVAALLLPLLRSAIGDAMSADNTISADDNMSADSAASAQRSAVATATGLPSVVFFCYGLAKETVILLCALVIVRGLRSEASVWTRLSAVSAIAVATVIRYETVLPFLLVTSAVYGLFRAAQRIGAERPSMAVAVTMMVCAVAAVAADSLLLDYRLLGVLSGERAHFDEMVAGSALIMPPVVAGDYPGSSVAAIAGAASAILPVAFVAQWRGIDLLTAGVALAELLLLVWLVYRERDARVTAVAIGAAVSLSIALMVVTNAGTGLRHRAIAMAWVTVALLAASAREPTAKEAATY